MYKFFTFAKFNRGGSWAILELIWFVILSFEFLKWGFFFFFFNFIVLRIFYQNKFSIVHPKK